MDKLIQWPRAKYWDKPWNPIIGCKPCSPACEHCYARAWAKRFGQSFKPHRTTHENPPRKGVVFCGNMTDLFGEWVQYPEHFIPHGIDAGETADAVLWLTKRPERLVKVVWYGFVLDYVGKGWMKNQFFGMTAENQKWLDHRYAEFRKLPAHMNGWLSAEPLLGPIEIGLLKSIPEARPFQWVVVGCESGPHRRPCKIEWVESIVEQCRAAGVPVFVKQLDIGGKCVTDINKFPEHLRIRQVPWA